MANTRILAALVTVVAIASFTLSYHALVELAVQSRIPQPLSYLMPICVDGTALVAMFCTTPLRSAPSRFVRAYPWVVTIAAMITSAIANGLHAEYVTLAGGARAVIASIPAVSLGISAHLAMEVGRVSGKTPARRRPVPVKTPAAAVAPATTKPKSAGVQWVLDHVTEQGSWPTGPAVAEALNVSRKTGARYVAAAKATS